MALYMDIEKSFKGFHLSVQLEGEKEVLALLGASGCGKSMTLKCIAGIEKPDRGVIVLNNKTVFDSKKGIQIPPQKRKVGFLFQNYALFPTMTVWDNIACVIKKTKSEKVNDINEVIKMLYLGDVKYHYPKQLSGGQQQRVALARILASNPEILMLDEPFSALDSYLKWNLEQEIFSVLEKFQGTTLFVSHNHDEVYRLCKKIFIMKEGRIESTGDRESVFDTPKTVSAALITGCSNISAIEKINDYTFKAIDWGLELVSQNKIPEDRKYVGVHAQHLEQAEHAHDENTFPCHIYRIMEDPFFNIIVFSHESAINERKESRLQYKIDKGKWNNEMGQHLKIKIPKDKLIFLA